MNRISNQMINNTMTYNLQRHQREMDKMQNQLATGKKIRTPSDNPSGAANQMLYRTRLSEIDQYLSNLSESTSRLNEADTALQSSVKIFQRIRVLAVQGANGIYSSFELKEAAAAEVDQLLEQLVAIANTKGATGRAIFGGYMTGTQEQPNPFVPIYESLNNGQTGEKLIGVEYRGNIGEQLREIATGDFMSINTPGNEAFWATNQILTSGMNSENYIAKTNSVIKIDNTEIAISAGDNTDIIIEKINNSGVSVKASKGGRNNLVLASTTPHQIWLEDKGSGTVLQDLGMVSKNLPEPPNNIAPTVDIGGMSVFEVVIRLRDDFIRGDQELIGGRDLGAVDMAIENILRYTASVGARQNRVDQVAKATEYEKSNITDILAKNEAIDYPETIMNFKWLESVHNYALAVGAKSIKPTLMDFLR